MDSVAKLLDFVAWACFNIKVSSIKVMHMKQSIVF